MQLFVVGHHFDTKCTCSDPGAAQCPTPLIITCFLARQHNVEQASEPMPSIFQATSNKLRHPFSLRCQLVIRTGLQRGSPYSNKKAETSIKIISNETVSRDGGAPYITILMLLLTSILVCVHFVPPSLLQQFHLKFFILVQYAYVWVAWHIIYLVVQLLDRTQIQWTAYYQQY